VTVVLGAVVVVDDFDLDTALRLKSSLIYNDRLAVVGIPWWVDHVGVSIRRSRSGLRVRPLLRRSARSRRAVNQDNALLVVSRSPTLAVQVEDLLAVDVNTRRTILLAVGARVGAVWLVSRAVWSRRCRGLGSRR
jgi:hypothetical protein